MTMLRPLILALTFFALVPAAALAETRQVPQSQQEITLSYAPLVKRTAPAVVNVYAKTVVAQRDQSFLADPFFRRFFGDDGSFGRPRERVQNSLGSGVIVDKAGLIVTNNHVIRNGTDIRVVLADKREYEAQVILTDERTDLAVLRINTDGEELPTLGLADSDNLDVGDLVLAIGNPFGVGQTVTSGIVSALARTRVGVSDYQFFIQTDAAINPGNSGGALVNMQGELVGINTAIFSRSGGSVGIGFAIPSNMVTTVVQTAEQGKEKIKRPWLGVDLQDVTADLAENLGLARPEGALITKLHPQSPLLAAGLKRGDIVIGFDGKAIENAQEFGFRVATVKIGESRIVEYRRNGDDQEAQVAMVPAPETVPREETVIDQESPLVGMKVANLSPAVAEEVDLAPDTTGVVALAVEADPARQFFKKGDVILGINGEEIADVEALKKALTDQSSRSWKIDLLRNKKRLVMRLR
ncbi:MAG: DegQ family serine endoprotease [Proteobacteria bacterium]|nr:DegQ family serine endoprotease [Pseudomonadota bacterium]